MKRASRFASRFVLVGLLAGLAAVSAAAGCASASADQCSAGGSGNADCERVLGVAAGQALCDNGTCRLRGTPPPSQNEAGTSVACTSTAECTAANGGNPSLCREPGQKPCVPLTTDRCTVFGNSWKEGNDPIFVGVILNKTLPDGTQQSYSRTNERIMQLAESEWFSTTTGGLNVGGKRRPLVGVYCDSGGAAETARAAFDHLTLGLGAPAVIAESAADLAWFLDEAKDRETFVYLTEFGCDEIALSGKLNGRCYTTGPTYDFGFPLWKERIKQLEAEVRADRGMAATDKIKVAFLANRLDGVSATAFIEALDREIEINGALAPTQPASYREINPSLLPDGSIDYLRTAKTITDFAPDIVMTLEARTFHFWYLPLIEASWPAGVPRPRYMTNESAAFPRRYAVSVGGNEPLRRRVGGIWAPFEPASDPVITDLQGRFLAAYGEENVDFVSTGLDAFYATAYGIAAALSSATVQGGNLKGTDIGQAMKRLVGGQLTELVPSKIPSALAVLAQGGTLDLLGTMNHLDWDPVNGSPGQDAAVYCVVRSDDGSLDVQDLGLFYKYKTKSFDPPLPFSGACP